MTAADSEAAIHSIICQLQVIIMIWLKKLLDGKIKINKNILSDGLNLPLMLYLLTGSEWQPIIFFQNLLPPIFLEKNWEVTI